jgi:hypothetical protein
VDQYSKLQQIKILSNEYIVEDLSFADNRPEMQNASAPTLLNSDTNDNLNENDEKENASLRDNAAPVMPSAPPAPMPTNTAPSMNTNTVMPSAPPVPEAMRDEHAVLQNIPPIDANVQANLRYEMHTLGYYTHDQHQL